MSLSCLFSILLFSAVAGIVFKDTVPLAHLNGLCYAPIKVRKPTVCFSTLPASSSPSLCLCQEGNLPMPIPPGKLCSLGPPGTLAPLEEGTGGRLGPRLVPGTELTEESNYVAEMAKLRKKVVELNEQLAEAEAKNANGGHECQQKIRALTEQLEKAKIGGPKCENNGHSHDIDSTNEAMSMSMNSIEAEERLAKKESLIEELSQRIAELQQQKEETNEELRKKLAEASELREAVEEKSKQINGLLVQLNESRQAVQEEMDGMRQKLQQQIRKLETEEGPDLAKNTELRRMKCENETTAQRLKGIEEEFASYRERTMAYEGFEMANINRIILNNESSSISSPLSQMPPPIMPDFSNNTVAADKMHTSPVQSNDVGLSSICLNLILAIIIVIFILFQCRQRNRRLRLYSRLRRNNCPPIMHPHRTLSPPSSPAPLHPPLVVSRHDMTELSPEWRNAVAKSVYFDAKSTVSAESEF